MENKKVNLNERYNLKMAEQLSLFDDYLNITKVKNRSGTFVDNMKLPIHRWFRYSAGFSAEWVSKVLIENNISSQMLVLDPFAGSGTTLLAADKVGINSIGIEAHPFIVRVAKAKLSWDVDASSFLEKALQILEKAKKITKRKSDYPNLILRCYPKETLDKLDALKQIWLEFSDNSKESELIWLAITSILRITSPAGTAQWQYILPNKNKKIIVDPFKAFEEQTYTMYYDIRFFQKKYGLPKSTIIQGDARNLKDLKDDSVDIIITSPPYANNYDYADATRFEMSFWNEIENWGDLHEKVRKYLIRSSSQHVSKEKLILDDVLSDSILLPIRNELYKVCEALGKERLLHGGKKHYHTMIAAYFSDLGKIWKELSRVCKSKSKVCFVIGDSAPYGIYVPVEEWLGKLALAAGFQQYRFEKIRDRNIKWKNRKHRIPLKEGFLWVFK